MNVVEGYDAARTSAAVYGRQDRGLIAVTGPDAATFLHGMLTNDIERLEPGEACYAAYLTPQGRMIADMDVLRVADGVLLDVEPLVRDDLLRRLDQSIFAEAVAVADRSGNLSSIGVCGPSAAAVLGRALAAALGTPGGAPPATDRHITIGSGEGATTVLGTVRAGVEGFHLFGPPASIDALWSALLAEGARPLGGGAAESLRIEAGIPRFGVDMTGDTIPLEAGIEGRAISMTKGCYIGQEVIIRILHRGQGRVAKRLVGLRIEGDAAPAPGSRLEHEGREAGIVTSAAVSPRLGPIALGYVHRDLASPGTRLATAGGLAVVVSSLPFAA